MIFIFHVQNLDFCIDSYINSLRDEVKQMEPLMQRMWPNTDDEEMIMNADVTSYIIS
jgi:hypothetical protein